MFFTLAELNAILSGLNCNINAKLSYQISAWKDVPIKDASGKVTGYGLVELANGGLFAHLYGRINLWDAAAGPSGESNLHYKVAPDFGFDPNVEALPDEQHAIVLLNRPTVITIPLDAVAKGEDFKVMVVVSADVNNRRPLESFVGARFRDPQRLSGVSFDAKGVELIPFPPGSPMTPPAPTPQPAPACNGPADPAAGTLQFESATVYAPEASGLGDLLVWVTRSGGGAGEISATFSTQDGSAHAGVDYKAVTSLVRFDDGEQGKRYVSIPIINNQIIDGVRTATLTLSGLRGCATLGATSQATLSIIDDDLPPPPSAFLLGGTVSGLTGSGLVLRTTSNEQVQPAGNGAFAFSTSFANGLSYSVSVATQPSNPVQICSVANGSGTIAGANVTNVAVTCTTPPPNGALDAGFGSAGKVSNALGAVKAIALQADGKLLALSDLALSRYNADGTADTGFGIAGKVSIVANGGPLDAMQALALQSDGKIVVAGYSALPTSFNDDIVVLRYLANGSLDTSFGTGGKVVNDFVGLTDRAYAVRVQSDGNIVVAGFATLGTLATADQDVAVLRYLSNGTLDAGFGSGGKATKNVVGKSDFGYALALQIDGKVVVAGRVGLNGGSNPDFGVVRFLADGNLDSAFGTAGFVRVDFGGAVWDEAADIAIQPDGKIVLAGFANIAGLYRYALVRLDGSGVADAGFGSQGLVSTAFSGGNDMARGLALQADGHIVVAGQLANTSTNPDFGVARYSDSGVRDVSFGSAGLVRVDYFGGIDNATDVLVQPDGKIVVGGSARNAGTTGLALIRLMP